mmetsp:Transcript_6774/g.12566  ORF Transcript_6774/g.12566 Transcript_6774/m.12566 type:complete len:206 (+) Transcript_6774:536-1153(+)
MVEPRELPRGPQSPRPRGDGLVRLEQLGVEQRALHDVRQVSYVGGHDQRRLGDRPHAEFGLVLILRLLWAVHPADAFLVRRAAFTPRHQKVHVRPRPRFSPGQVEGGRALVNSARRKFGRVHPVVVVVPTKAPRVGIVGRLVLKEVITSHSFKIHRPPRRVEGRCKILVPLRTDRETVIRGVMFHVATPVKLHVVNAPVCKRLCV